MKYDLRVILIFLIFVKFQRGFFEVSKSRNNAAVIKPGDLTLFGPQVVTTI